MRRMHAVVLNVLGMAVCSLGLPAVAQEDADPIDPPPTPKQWADLARLPDWSGVWTPDMVDQVKQVRTNPPPWTPSAARQIAELEAQEAAGHPKLIFMGCLPESMPSWMLISHNSMEILFTPGRVTMLARATAIVYAASTPMAVNIRIIRTQRSTAIPSVIGRVPRW
jgi:hypothetical protein